MHFHTHMNKILFIIEVPVRWKGDYLFVIVGYSVLPPTENMGSVAGQQINAMESQGWPH